MNKTNLLLTAVTTAMLAACGSESGDAPSPIDKITPVTNTLVYEGRQSVQCGTRGLTTQQSAQKLVDGGIDVLESNCGVITGMFYAAVCGGGTGDILIHKIRKENLADAEALGFKSVTELQDPAQGTDYAKVDCDTGVLIP